MAVEMNPYAAPASAVEQASGEYGEPTIFSFMSRAGRLRYFTRSMIATIAAYVVFTVLAMAIGIFVAASGASEEEIGTFIAPALLIPMAVIGLAMLVVGLMLGMQRLHDLDLSGWFFLLMIVPLVNFVFGLYMLFAPGTKGPNRFGMPPPPNTFGIKLTAGILAFVWIVSVVGFLAIGIGAYGEYAERVEQLQTQ